MDIIPSKPPLGIYIHWPFCVSKCPYCDFNSHVRARIDQQLWLDSLKQELSHYKEETADALVHSIFFGGGTPSLMDPFVVEELINYIVSNWKTIPDLEITLEANPGSVEVQKFAAYAKAGVNRISVGVQSFNDDDLKFLGRKHSSDEAHKAIHIAGQYFNRFSFDLIYARPDQSWDVWQRELETALAYKPQHLSLYQLTIEPGTAFYTKHQRGELVIPEADAAAELYERTSSTLKDAGLNTYEVSNYAAPGHECRHNMIYWRYQDYLGIGPGAHGRLTDKTTGLKCTTQNIKAPESWLKAVSLQGHGCKSSELLTAESMFHEYLLMGLRLEEGIQIDNAPNLIQKQLMQLLKSPRLQMLVDTDLLVMDTSKSLKATPDGMLRLNGVLEYLQL